jgi:histidinol-phosphate phosphatase family protein
MTKIVDMAAYNAGVAPRRRNGLVLLDRDGTLNVMPKGRQYITDPAAVVLMPGVAEGLRLLRQHFYLVVVTNQSAVGRGMISVKQLDSINNQLVALLHREGVWIDAMYICTHTSEDKCRCRKPETLLGETAITKYGGTGSLYMVGDQASDALFGLKLRAHVVVVTEKHSVVEGLPKSGHVKVVPEFIYAAREIALREGVPA